jgi:hypothetical protein
MNLLLNDTTPLALKDDVTADDFINAISVTLNLPKSVGIVIADPQDYAIYEDGKLAYNSTWLSDVLAKARSSTAEAPAKLDAVKLERCMHMSPGIPGRGFLCGWC